MHQSEWLPVKSLQIIIAREGLDIVDGDVNWCSHYGKQAFLEKLKIELSYYTEIALLGIYPEKITLFKKIHASQCLYGSTLSNSQEMEAIHVSIN